MQTPRPKLSLPLSLTLWVVFGGLPVETEADHRSHRVRAGSHGHGGHQARATSHRPAHRPGHGAPVRQPRSLLPPAGLGSAANAPPGFYQRLNAPQIHHQPGHHHGHGVPVAPVYVYLEPPVYVEPPPPEPPPAPRRPVQQPRPVVIVQPQPAAAPVAAPQPAPAAASAPQPAPRSTEPSAVRFSILPLDAEVFLDDDYLGTGAELAALGESLLPPGVHVLEVSHPDHRPQRLIFGIGQETSHVMIDLSAEKISRRSKIR